MSETNSVIELLKGDDKYPNADWSKLEHNRNKNYHVLIKKLSKRVDDLETKLKKLEPKTELKKEIKKTKKDK